LMDTPDGRRGNLMMSRRRILFVDDEIQVLDGLRAVMHRHRREWQSHYAQGGNSALDAMAQHSFDVVVSDLRMPGVDGRQVLAAARISQPLAIRVVLSGFSQSESELRGSDLVHLFLSKPTNASELLSAIVRLLDRATVAMVPEQRRRMPGDG
jgi:DNA-binding NarL/FixJ family response regulator